MSCEYLFWAALIAGIGVGGAFGVMIMLALMEK